MPSFRPAHLVALAVCLVPLGGCATSGPTTSPGASVALGEVAVSSEGGDLARGRAETGGADRQVVRTARIGLEVESEGEIPAVIRQAGALAASMGGFVAAEGPRTLTLRVPDTRLDEALDRLGGLADEEEREVRAEDVTAAAIDLQTRLDNARALQVRLRALLDEAETVADVLAVEVELARVTANVERLDAQMRLLQSQVALSTVHVSVWDDADPGPVGWVFVGLYETVKWLLVWD